MDLPRNTPELAQATEKLRASEQHFRLLIESVRDYAIFLLGPKGHVTSWNPGAERAKGYAEAEILGQHFSVFYPEADILAGKCEMELAGAIRDGRYEDEGWRKRKDGTLFWANVVITALWDKQGEHVGFAKVTRDLTERRRAEEERVRLVATQKAREAADAANRAKDDFLAHVSHELRTPLNAILGWSRLLASLEGDKRARATETIERNADAMRQLIDDLLDVSRIISGRMRLDLESVDLALVVGRAVESIKVSADARKIELHASLDDAANVEGDPSRLQQIIWNVLTNAVKFTPTGGRISVLLHRVASSAEIVVQDSGRGIAPESIPQIFEPFWQVKDAPNRNVRGLGLGLAISRKLVELHNGRIDATSAGLGEGTTFVVTLPLAEARERSSAAPVDATRPMSSARPRLDGLRILVVEDDDDARALVQTIMADCGGRVTTASDVPEAIVSFESEPPDVLLSDIGLPGQNGYDLIQWIRSLPPERGGRVPAVAMTAYARTDDRDRALTAGFTVHLPKPVEPAELAVVVAALVGRNA